MQLKKKITPCLWFDSQAEAAAGHYTGIFPDSKIVHMRRYGEAGQETHGQAAGSVLAVEFELNGQPFTAINGGPIFRFNEAISLQVECQTQEEIDYYWNRLGEGGDPKAQQCGWLKDKFGLSWQVLPSALKEMMGGPDRARSERTMNAMLKMKKMNLAELQRAYAG